MTAFAPATAPRVPDDTTLLAAARRGDPLGDAAAAVRGGHRQVVEALRSGTTPPEEATAALVQDLLARTAAVAPDVLTTGSRPHFTVPPAVHVLDVGAGALIRSYAPPEPATILVGTGQLVDDTERRLWDTARWLNQIAEPGGLRPGRDGLVATASVRLMHAGVRRQVTRTRPPGPGAPVHISQLDLLRTWTDFTVAAPRAASRLGQDLTEEEYATFLTFWRHVGTLLGIEPELLAGVRRRRDAVELDARIVSLTPPPNADSRRLTEIGLTTLAHAWSDISPLPRRVTVPVIHAIARTLQGPELSDALGIPRAPAHRLVPVVAAAARWRRNRLRRNPIAWERMIERNLETAAGMIPAAGA
ncbi:oxygenase MpaB family protein [Kineococcus gynurae]|uniref:Oxygenase MpaB family protein n=1 Tax=Kineococcus gynurae TaxID=452979 RepID=A0ABV5LP36_9ACTN